MNPMAEARTESRAADVWYHGSPEEMVTLRVGSTIIQDRTLATAFSQKPSLLVQNEGRIRHNGRRPGLLYAIAEAVTPDDITPVPGSTMGPGQEWVTRRPLRLVLLERTILSPEDAPSDAEVASYRQRLAERQAAKALERPEGR
jgi:hypothetical protein